MILSCQSICKSFGEKVILQDASFHIEEREKAALIGNNGAGKTTLLRIIMEEISADSGQVVIAKDKKIGYLAQYQDIHGHHTIYEELMTTKQYILDMEDKIRSLEQEMKYVAGDKLESLMNSYTRLTHQFELENGYAYKSEIVGVLKGLGFEEEDYGKQIENLSGGQKTRGCTWQASDFQAGYPPSGRAYQPSGYGEHCLAGNLSSQLPGRCIYRFP